MLNWKCVLQSALCLVNLLLVDSGLALGSDLQLGRADRKAIEVRYPQRVIESDLSDYEKYWQGLLKLALQKSGTPFHLVAVDGRGLTHARIARNLNSDGSINVAYMGTSPEFEERLLPIRIPVFRGLIGYRILMIRDDKQPLFNGITDLSGLKGVSLGLGIQWSDVPIMRDAGFDVVQVHYENLFKALDAGRFNAVSRAAHEIGPELEILAKKYTQLVAERSLIIGFRQASFFFVGKDDHALADVIRNGLLNAYHDGSFMQYFDESPVVQRAKQLLLEPQRKLLWIENRELSEQARMIPLKFWFTINE